jgi:hypothetical protein
MAHSIVPDWLDAPNPTLVLGQGAYQTALAMFRL